jgi:polyketide synthase PksL
MLNIVSILQNRAKKNPEQPAYLFLENGMQETAKLNYAELDKNARIIASYLQTKIQPGQRVLLLYPADLNFVSSFMGCLYAGVIAVPVNCPQPQDFMASAPLLTAIAQDADIQGILTVSTYIEQAKRVFIEYSANSKLFIVDTTLLENEIASNYKLPILSDDTIAYLQYTSGSTSAPKGAIVRHENLSHSLKYTAKVWHYTKNSITLNWAPHTHVYGLVCGILVPLYHGSLAILMSPKAFIERPLTWLEAITKYQVTHSGCPNFGYEICIRDIPDNLQNISLKSWKVAINGGENVQYETLNKFYKKFRTYHFQLKQFCSAYGMSETTGAIAVSRYNEKFIDFNLSKEELKNNKAILIDSVDSGTRFVSSGNLLPGLTAVIVDPDTLQPVIENTIGEIWLAGKSVISGYWCRAEETKAVFDFKLAGLKEKYFRTGDLGFMQNGEICLTGRLKEIIVVHGKKYYPLDLEFTVKEVLKDFPINNVQVAFSASELNKEGVIFVQEIKDGVNIDVQYKIIQKIRQSIMKHYGVDLQEVILVKEHSIPKTSSGKLQRKKCQKEYLENKLNVINKNNILKDEDKNHFIEILASILKLELSEINLDAPISQYRFDSILIIQLTSQLNDSYGLSLTPAVLYEYSTLGEFYRDKLEEKKSQQLEKKVSSTNAENKDIAIIGINGIFPDAPDVKSFWHNLISGKDVISEIPPERWDWQAYDCVKWGGFINGISHFDADFFNISPYEAELTDPQQRLFLQTVWKVIEDAGYSTKSIAAKTGLFVGVFNHDYAELLQKNDITDALLTTGITTSMLANRVSYLLNLQGPSEVIDTACSSSLVAIHHAVQAINNGDCDIAIAGGANALITPTSYISASKASMLSSDGRCKTFDKSANGYVRSEGIAAILLKPLEKALLDGDYIYGVIKGSAVNHGGHVNSLTAPNPNAQAEVIFTACERANIGIDTLQYIETHGTGTALGDPIEINGLIKAFNLLTERQNKKELPSNYCGLGSLKSNIGHLEATAGIAGVIKVLLAMQHQKIPGNLHFDELNPYIKLENSPFYIINKTQFWPRLSPNLPRRAGVSSFGFGGTNAHVIIEEHIQLNKPEEAHTAYPIILSAKNDSALHQIIENLYEYIISQTHLPRLSAISYTLTTGRNHFAKRCVFIVDSVDHLILLLNKVIKGEFSEDFVSNSHGSQLLKNKNKYKELSFNVNTELESRFSLNEYREYLLELANSYVEGDDINWEKLFVDSIKQRIPLPTYPFSNDKYWIPKSERTPLSSASLHPLIDANISTLEVQKFTKRFNGKEFYFTDHQINGESVLPGVVFLEMAMVAGKLAAPTKQIIGFKNIIWERLLKTSDPYTNISIQLYPQENNVWFEITSETDLYVQGEIIYDLAVASDKQLEELNIKDVKSRCNKQKTGHDIYAAFNDLGLYIGSSLQVIQNVWINKDAAFAEINLPLHFKDYASQFVLHPSLLDGILHVSFALIDEKNYLYLPTNIERIDVYHQLPSFIYVYATKIKEIIEEGLLKFNIIISDIAGKVIMEIKSFCLSAKQIKPQGIYYYNPVWRESLLPQVHEQNILTNTKASIILFDDSNDVAESLQAAQFNVSHLNMTDLSQIDPILNNYVEEGLLPIHIIIRSHISNLDTLSTDTIQQHLDKSCYFLFRLSQILIQKKINIPLQILWVNTSVSLFTEALEGFAKTLFLEQPHLICRIVELNHIKDILRELSGQGFHVRYDNNNIRWVKCYAELKPASEFEHHSIFKQKGTYLITGGLGELGLKIADYLTKKYHANIILSGRSDLLDKNIKKISELQSVGAKVIYIKADISKQYEAKHLITTIKNNYNILNGVIHAAGVINDDYILRKSIQSFSSVLAAKVNGTLYLDDATSDMRLDFFVLFSSIASTLGNIGQCDYAYANCFLDAFSSYREMMRNQNKRFGKTISINWPLWAEGGFSIDKDIAHQLEKNIGITSLKTEEGIQAFEHAMKQQSPVQTILRGDKQKIELALQRYSNVSAMKIEKNDFVNTHAADFQNQAEVYFKKLLESILKLPAGKMSSEEPFENYGIDSVMIIKLNQHLADIFGDLSKTLFFEYQNLSALTRYFVDHHATILLDKIGMAQQAVHSNIDNSKPSFSRQKSVPTASMSHDIAIIGLSGKYPKSPDLESFWENLKSGTDCINEIPKDRWDVTKYFDTDKTKSGKYYSKWGGFIDDVDKFDPLFFNISPHDAELMDPQERLFLETTWKTIEDAGYSRESLIGKDVGVFVGVMYGQYQLFSVEEAIKGNHVFTHSFYASIANRVSYYFDFHGPSIAIDTLCSSSITAIHLACQSIINGESSLAIAGGVNVSIHPNKYILLSKGKFLSTDGRCRSFGEGGDGYVPGEGVGSILLKPLEKALSEGDHIYGVIKGSSINHGGKTNGYTVPNPISQAKVVEKAYITANINPTTVSYIETHGTGTSLGDPIEIEGLNRVFSRRESNSPCIIGSVKSNIGHCESAAGIAAVTKVLLQMQHKALVPSLHSEFLNPNINWENTVFKVQRELSEWTQPPINSNEVAPRRAGISSFGAGGSNAHIIIEEGPDRNITSVSHDLRPYYLITLSAKTETALMQRIVDLERWLARSEKVPSLENICFTLNVGRSHFEKRCALVVSTVKELQAILSRIYANESLSNAFINLNAYDKLKNQGVFNKVYLQLIKELTGDHSLTTSEYRDNLLTLASFYVDGYQFDWNLLPQSVTKQKISMPTYPFAKDRCWWSSDSVNEQSQPAILSISNEMSLNNLEEIQDTVKKYVSEQLKMELSDINLVNDLSDYGMDSIGFINLANFLSNLYHMELTPAKFYIHKSIKAISQYLISEFKDIRDDKPQVISHGLVDQSIAIIGIDGTFPQSKDLDSFWENLISGKDLISEVPLDRWDWQNIYGDDKQDTTKTNSKWGGFLNQIDKFDAEFFNISTREANLMDPQHRLFLETVWRTIENAGYNPFSLAGENIGVFSGVEFSEYHTLLAKQQNKFHGFIATGNSHSMLANRISYYFDFHGPSESIDTACSSSLVAVHRAVQALRAGECQLAIAGGVSLIIDPDTYVIISQLGALSSDGRCKTFDKSANGYVKGEGVGAILLKPLSQAKSDGDFIYAVIKGSAVNHGGKAQSLTAPNALAQSELLVNAYKSANISPDTISFIETHGTGTALGDPVEIEGLKLAFKKLSKTENKLAYCGLGALKTNIGHLEPASGVASIIKVLLAMQHQKIPGNLHFDELNPYIQLENSPFYLINHTQEWKRLKNSNGLDIPRRAGISSFGFGGANAHVILEEGHINYQNDHSLQKTIKPYYLITLSARCEKSLEQKVIDLYNWIQKQTIPINLESLSYTLNVGKAHFNARHALVVNSIESLSNLLQELINNLLSNDIKSGVIKNKFNHSTVLDKNYLSAIEVIKRYNEIDSESYHKELLVIADLFIQDYPIDWQWVHVDENKCRLASLPAYPFNKQKFWYETPLLMANSDSNLPVKGDVSISLDAFTLSFLTTIFAEILEINTNAIQSDQAFETFGVDSILGLEIIERLEKVFGSLSKSMLYEINNLHDLSKYFLKNFSDKLNELLSSTNAALSLDNNLLLTDVVNNKNIDMNSDKLNNVDLTELNSYE